MKNLAHSASFHAGEKIAPSNPGIKHLGRAQQVGSEASCDEAGAVGGEAADDVELAGAFGGCEGLVACEQQLDEAAAEHLGVAPR
mgnify:CR=1 FL=1